jgi:hypothetical protein
MKSCVVDGCTGAHRARGYCYRHYTNILRYGQRTSPNRDPIARFIAKVASADANGCEIWIGALTTHGYGAFWADGRQVAAHRFSYETFIGPIPDGLDLDHVWDRGCRSKACVNPSHLEPVTERENTRRAYRARSANNESKETAA